MDTPIPREQKNPNPQGKGALAVLQDLASVRAQHGASKDAAEMIRDYCLSSLVLAARFGFKPVPGQAYYLYSDEQEWTLSLISPEQWRRRQPGEFVAECLLRADMTWDLSFADLDARSPVRPRLARFVEGFAEAVPDRQTLLEGLPFYARQLPYYQRMLATGLAASLQYSTERIEPQLLEQALPLARSLAAPLKADV